MPRKKKENYRLKTWEELTEEEKAQVKESFLEDLDEREHQDTTENDIIDYYIDTQEDFGFYTEWNEEEKKALKSVDKEIAKKTKNLPTSLLVRKGDKIYKDIVGEGNKNLLIAGDNKLRNLFKIIEAVNNEATIEFNEKGMFVKLVDTSNTSMLIAQVGYDMFSELKIPLYSDKATKITCDLNKLNKLAKAFRHDIVLEVEDLARLYLKSSSYSSKYKIALLNEECSIPKTPELKPTTKINLHTDTFFKAVDNAKRINEDGTIQFITDGKELKVKSYDTELTMEYEDTLHTRLLEGKSAKSMYSLDLIDKIKPIKQLAHDVVLEFADDYPMIMTFPIIKVYGYCYSKEHKGETEKKIGEIQFIVAPRIDD